MTFDQIFSTFKEVSFPKPCEYNVIYAVGVEFNQRFVPFYIGETSRSIGGRIGDYVFAQIKAKPDFKVGVAVETIRSRREDVKVKVKFESANAHSQKRKHEEENLIHKMDEEFKRKEFSSGLLNHLTLNYDEANPRPEEVNQARKDIEEWVTKFVRDLESWDMLGSPSSH
jgi:hypothetical protein